MSWVEYFFLTLYCHRWLCEHVELFFRVKSFYFAIHCRMLAKRTISNVDVDLVLLLCSRIYATLTHTYRLKPKNSQSPQIEPTRPNMLSMSKKICFLFSVFVILSELLVCSAGLKAFVYHQEVQSYSRISQQKRNLNAPKTEKENQCNLCGFRISA